MPKAYILYRRSIAYALAFASALALLFAVNTTYAAAPLDSVLVASSTRYAQLTVTYPPALVGSSYQYEMFTTVTSFSSVTNAQHCWPRYSGSAAVPSQEVFNLDADVNNVNVTTGGSPNCRVSGTYYIAFDIDGEEYYVAYNYDADTNSYSSAAANYSFDTTYNTRFTAISATTTPTASTTLTFYPQYLIDLSEVNENDPKRFPSQVKVSLSKQPSVDFGARSDDILPLTATGTAEISFTNVEDGVYDFLVSFWNLASVFDNSKQPFDRSYIYGQVTISGGVISSFTTDEFYNGVEPPPQATRPCGLTDIDGCLYNAGVALFVPSDASIEDFVNLSDTLSQRFPFAYVYDFSEIALSLYTSSTTETLALQVPFGDLGTTTLISQAQLEAVPFAPFIKAVLGSLLWLMFALYAYRRSLKIFNKTT